ncbi:unnamed protein product [Closterium sp. NIES-65]|nr:unnamed protein product [Closterium sp. NIES-65]CAI6003822.1 unnamed protein product [Closterium sp. NIES-65]
MRRGGGGVAAASPLTNPHIPTPNQPPSFNLTPHFSHPLEPHPLPLFLPPHPCPTHNCVVRWGGRGTGTGGVVGSTGGATGLDGVQGADRERFGASSGVEATSPAAPNTPATSATPFTAAAKSTGGRAGKRCDWRMLALAAATPFPLSSSPPLRPSLFLRHGAATRQRDGGGSIGRLARGPVGGFVGGRAHTRAGGFVGGLAGALVGGSDGGSVGGFASGSVGRLAGALVGGTDSGSVGGFAGGSVPGVPGAFMACAVACVAGSERATG